jgi:hypothetical protein
VCAAGICPNFFCEFRENPFGRCVPEQCYSEGEVLEEYRAERSRSNTVVTFDRRLNEMWTDAGFLKPEFQCHVDAGSRADPGYLVPAVVDPGEREY